MEISVPPRWLRTSIALYNRININLKEQVKDQVTERSEVACVRY